LPLPNRFIPVPSPNPSFPKKPPPGVLWEPAWEVFILESVGELASYSSSSDIFPNGELLLKIGLDRGNELAAIVPFFFFLPLLSVFFLCSL
jgi:hypothetical protein